MKKPDSPRQWALIKEEKFYYSKKPCKRGHWAPRYTSNYVCTECHVIDARAWTRANPEKHLTFTKKWRAANREKYRENDRIWKQAYREAKRMIEAENGGNEK